VNKTDPEHLKFLRGKRTVAAAEARVSDLLLEQTGLVERIEKDLLPEDGIVTSGEIYEGLGLVEA
jgi:hypothetical protein